MKVFRLCRAPYRQIDGEGAKLHGGRWNSPGRPVVYTSDSLALAALEYLVHLDVGDVPADLVALAIEVPDDLPGGIFDQALLPARWAELVDPAPCKAIGDAWLTTATTTWLRVPAAPIHNAATMLNSPQGPDFKRITVVDERPFHYDPRLLE